MVGHTDGRIPSADMSVMTSPFMEVSRTLGGRAHECNYDFERDGALWASFDKLTVEGHSWNGVGTRTPGTNDGPEIGVNIPIYSGNW